MVKIKCLFSRNKLIGSRLIAWASGLLVKDLDKVPSHAAILIELGSEKLVIESVMSQGVRIVPYHNWLQINEECYSIEIETTKDVIQFVKLMWGKKYDYPGILYFAWRFLLYLLFKVKFPKENKWATCSRYFCNELMGKLIDYKNYSMVTPAKMCSDLLKAQNNK